MMREAAEPALMLLKVPTMMPVVMSCLPKL